MEGNGGGRLVLNEVRMMDTPRGAARIRLQIQVGGVVSFRAEPEKGERDDELTLAVIRIICEHAERRTLRHRQFMRRYREEPKRQPVDIVDAVDFYDEAAALRVLRELPGLLSAQAG